MIATEGTRLQITSEGQKKLTSIFFLLSLVQSQFCRLTLPCFAAQLFSFLRTGVPLSLIRHRGLEEFASKGGQLRPRVGLQESGQL